MGDKIDTNSGWLRVVKTRPVSYGWSDHPSTTLRVKVKPPKTALALMVSRITSWLTMLSRLGVSGGGSPSTPYHVRLKSGGAYLGYSAIKVETV